MSRHERSFAASLVAGVLLLLAAGAFAFLQEHRLGVARRMAYAENVSQQDLNLLTSRLMDVRRKGFNYILLPNTTSLDDFNNAVDVLKGLEQTMEGQPWVFGGPERVDPLVAGVNDYIADYQRIVGTARSSGSAAALRQAGELIESGKLDQALGMTEAMEERNITVFAERSSQIDNATRLSMLAIGLFISLAVVLILASVGMLLGYYRKNQALLHKTTALNRNLEESRKEMESIVSFVSHDLRAPLINIRGFSGAIAEDRGRLGQIVDGLALNREAKKEFDNIVGDSMPEALGYIDSAAESMDKLIKTMVKVARAGQLPLHPQRINMGKLVGRIVKDFEFRIQQTGAKVHVGALPGCIADRDQVRQVFSNLVDNAIKYREPSRPLQLRITGAVEAGQSVYCIEDNGVGISKRDLQGILEMYYQVKGRDAGGEGLGLAIAKKMIERNAGALEVRSQLHEGTKFFIKLKTATIAEAPAIAGLPRRRRWPRRKALPGA